MLALMKRGARTRVFLALVAAWLVAPRASAQDKGLVVPKEAPQMQRTAASGRGAPSVSLDLGAQKVDRLKVLSTSAQGWQDQGASPIKQAAGNTATVVVAPNQQVLVRPSEDSPRPVASLSPKKLALPGLLVANTTAATAESEAKVSSFRLFVQALHVPLRWSEAAAAYETELVVGVDDEGNAASATTLVNPIVVQLLGRNLSAIEPEVVKITESGPAGYAKVRVRTQQHAQKVEIAAHTL